MDTIFAIATAPVKAGVAVIRVSGAKAGEALAALTGKPLPAPRVARLAKLYNPENNELIDEALVLWFKAPASFTGEDVAELHVHGGRAVINETLSCLGKIKGLRTAEPGEFSRRAFENGKMDLTEAEGLADLIDAETKAQAKMALRQKQGELGRLYENWREEVLLTLANIEAYIDFPDEEIPENVVGRIEETVAGLIASISHHLNDNKRGERLRAGLSVAIIGAPNAGKSSLVNLLAQRDVAIVSAHAGTTRDIIEVHLDLGGYPVIIADTAGIREGAGEIEAEGIKRAIARAEDADLRIVVVDASEVGEGLWAKRKGKEDGAIFPLPLALGPEDKNTIIVFNKIDITGEKNLPEICGIKPIAASFKSGSGIEEILSAIRSFAEENLGSSSDPVITRERHRALLQETLASLQGFSLGKDIELAAEDLRCAGTSIGRITGRIDVEEILGKIFSSFCIGK